MNNQTRKTIIINKSLATSSTFSFSLLGQLPFKAKKMIIRQILYCNIAGADVGTYLLSCNLTQDYIASCYVGIQGNTHCPLTEIDIHQELHQIDFRLDKGDASFAGPSGLITLTLEFVA